MGSLNLEVDDAKRRAEVVVWLNSLFPELKLPEEATEWELRAQLFDGSVFNGILRMLNLGAVDETEYTDNASSEKRLEILKLFLSVVNELGLPSFQESDLEKGNFSVVLECLLSIRSHFGSTVRKDKALRSLPRCKSLQIRKLKQGESMYGSLADGVYGGSPVFGDDKKSNFAERKFQFASRNLVSDTTSALSQHAGGKLHEIFQLKRGQFSELSSAKISEIMKLNSLDNAPTQSLLSVANEILDESVERKNGEIPQRVACLLKKVMQEIERRITTQAEHIRHQGNLMKAREEKYLSRIKVLETLAKGSNEETWITANQYQVLQADKKKIEEQKRLGEEVDRLIKEKENSDSVIAELTLDSESTKRSYEQKYQHLETESNRTKLELERKIKEVEVLLEESTRRSKELEVFSESKFQNWNQKEGIFNELICLELRSLQDLRTSSQSIKEEFISIQEQWSEEIVKLGLNLKVLANAAENYHTVFLENQKLHNEVQELKGNIRVCCRIRPLLPRENTKFTIIDYIGENGELTIVNPSKHGKDGQKMFKFNKVFGPAATQGEVFSDIRPLVRSVLDGYNVCIFAYGQTGSGKTYTMSGPDSPSEEEWGVNYRALNDLFHISRHRRNTVLYEVGVQMIEIYNEQVRDLLSNDASQKRLGIVSITQSNGLAIPDASMHSVTSTSDVLELMHFGQANRAISATALNQTSSRSHSVVTIHVRGSDLKAGTTLYGSLHLVDLAGSERVERSEVTGDRLKETQHINKSLSALGDVIFALSQKSVHVPYRNSKLTQVLQSSLGGHAKTLMFVQINPDVNSYSESLSALKFAERVSGVELGAARSNKESKDIKYLTEQVASLKETIARKDEEIEQLQMLRESGAFSSGVNNVKIGSFPLRHSFFPPGISSKSLTSQQDFGLSAQSIIRSNNEATSDSGNNSDYSDRHSEISSQNSVDEKQKRESLCQTKHSAEEPGLRCPADSRILAFSGEDSGEGLNDAYNGGHLGSDGLVSAIESSQFPEQNRPINGTKEKMSRVTSGVAKSLHAKIAQETAIHPKFKDSVKSPTSPATKGALKPINSKDGLKSPSLKNNHSHATLSPAKPLSKRWQ
ncbi:LOW QUALITY PROTEIN: kinesin-like protein KIN-14C [Phalaenopsis equestris]|uniref:LOW QUALITY PROTEIN: kinesin-like protein KIN-14C n=1 Tax=Phalaenopsis equestris TaxID=78828 RepID=UPI0009E38419|nr:LOW QUALITY PROTEIN: kinesin-like protein KIN-14C [Phalaenopsis equestris]